MSADPAETRDAIERRARELAAAAPPLSDTTRQRLRSLLRNRPTTTRRAS